MRGLWGPIIVLACIVIFGRVGQDLVWRLWCRWVEACDNRRYGRRNRPPRTDDLHHPHLHLLVERRRPETRKQRL